MAAPAELKQRIRTFVQENLALGKGVTVTNDQESLVDSGVIDSLGVFQLVSFLEETFQVRIGDSEIVLENFRSIDDIERFVTRKRPDA